MAGEDGKAHRRHESLALQYAGGRAASSTVRHAAWGVLDAISRCEAAGNRQLHPCAAPDRQREWHALDQASYVTVTYGRCLTVAVRMHACVCTCVCSHVVMKVHRE